MPLLNYGLYDEFYMLKLVIVSLLIALIIITGTLFYKLYKDRLLKKRKIEISVRLDSLLDSFIAEKDDKSSQSSALVDIKSFFHTDKYFRDLLIGELKKRLDKDENNIKYKDLYYLLGGPEFTRSKLISKNSILIYEGLQETDRFDLLSEKDNLIRLQSHRDIKISLLASCILFKYKDEIKVNDILNLDSILCPMVEIRIFNEFKRHRQSRGEESNIINVINNCLKLEISDKLRLFLNKSVTMIDA